MKKIKYLIAISAIFAVSSCSDVLDTENLGEKSLESYYKTPTDIDEAMAGVYNAIYTNGIFSEEQISANLMDNMMLGGGGPDDKGAKWVDNFEDPNEDTFRDLWVQSYNGIARANAIIEKVPLADFKPYFKTIEEATQYKNQAIGEALFMRAFFYFRMVKFFGGVPLIVRVDDPKTADRATITEVYAQIASDLKLAIETMPATPFPSIPTSRYGHANKWVAEAYMGRVFLYYTGYMTNIEKQATTELPLVDGGKLNATQVGAYLSDCISKSGHRLATDFRNLWPYSYVNIAAGKTVLPWAETEKLSWVGQDGVSPTFGTGNYETMFVQRFSFGDWNWSNGTGNIYTNRYCLFNGLRGNSLAPFGEGWGWCTVNPKLFSGWDDADTRKRGSVLEVGKPEQGTGSYAASKGDHETGLFDKKYTSLQYDKGGSNVGMFVQIYNWSNPDMQLMHAQDFIYMRYADVLLMHSEITQTADGMNEVRRRAGNLPPKAYSLENIKEERLHEFAFEGLHWFDILRWGDVEASFNDTFQVNNSGTSANYTAKYRPETKGLVSIPETEIRLSNNMYKQNPGW